MKAVLEKPNVYVDPAIKLMHDLLGISVEVLHQGVSVGEYLSQLATRLLQGYESEHPGFRVFIDFSGVNFDEITREGFSLDDAKLCVAKAHSYINWQEVEEKNSALDPEYERLVDAMLAGDLTAVEQAIVKDPRVIAQTSSFPHHATLLHYTGSNGVEGYRQVVPENLAKIVELLLASGSDTSLKANVYGGCDAKGLLVTSKHPYEAGVIKEVKALYENSQGNG